MAVPLPSRRRPLLRSLVRRPWSRGARISPAVRRWCAKHGHLTPNFRVDEMADTGTGELPERATGPTGANVRPRANARRHCFNLERFRHELRRAARTPERATGISISIDGPYRTVQHNRAVGGAAVSRHTYGDASDHFADQVIAWAQAVRREGEPAGRARDRVIAIAERIFPGVGNENSGTLHLDSRPGPWVRFVTWRPAR